ncbi:MAG: hypothetical protein EBZ69_06985 [Alphaproteobacteria bacterium]|nr:hypothetical protein [Alphaproteobacteria bacterium]
MWEAQKQSQDLWENQWLQNLAVVEQVKNLVRINDVQDLKGNLWQDLWQDPYKEECHAQWQKI